MIQPAADLTSSNRTLSISNMPRGLNTQRPKQGNSNFISRRRRQKKTRKRSRFIAQKQASMLKKQSIHLWAKSRDSISVAPQRWQKVHYEMGREVSDADELLVLCLCSSLNWILCWASAYTERRIPERGLLIIQIKINIYTAHLHDYYVWISLYFNTAQFE